MAIIDVSYNNFKEEVLNEKIKVLIDFNADWCGPCRMLKPILEELSKRRNDIKIVSINVDKEEELARKYDIYSIPCLILIKDGEVLKKEVGLKSIDELEEIIGGE